MDRPYRPINCEFHDLLESLATLRSPARIEHLDASGAPQALTGVITDVFAQGGVEYLTLQSGESLRLDRLLTVNGAKEADF